MKWPHCIFFSLSGAIAAVLLLAMLFHVDHSPPRDPPRDEPEADVLPPNGTVHLLQYQGIPALDLTADEDWVRTSPFLCQSLLSAAYHDLQPSVLGPVPGVEPKVGKVAAIATYIRKGFVAPGEVILFYDTDILLLRGADAILAAARTFPLRTHIVFSAERNSWPTMYKYPPAPTSYRYPNTGAVLGIVGEQLMRFLDGWQRCVADGVIDTVCIHWFHLRHRRGLRYLKEPVHLHIDHGCALTQNAFLTELQHGVPGDAEGPAKAWLQDGRLFNPETGTHPALLHYNGDRSQMRATWNILFPGLSWDHPRTRRKQFSIWGRITPGREFCSTPITTPSPPPPFASTETLYGPPLPFFTKVWYTLLDTLVPLRRM